MRFADAITLFDRRNLACQIPDGRTGELGHLNRARRDSLISRVAAGLKRATGVAVRRELDDVELRPYVEVLPEMAYGYAAEAGLERPANYRSDVRTFLRVVEGTAPEKRTIKRHTSADAFLPDWRPLYDALAADAGDRRRRYTGSLERLQSLALQHGVRDPRRLPDYDAIAGWCASAGIAPKARGEMLTAYRTARSLAGRVDLPVLEAPTPASHRGVQTLPNLDALVAAGTARLNARRRDRARVKGQTAPPDIEAPGRIGRLDILDIVRALSPDIAEATRMYLKHAATDAIKSHAWREQVVRAMSATVAELHRLGPTRRPDGTEVPEDPFVLDLRALFTERRLVPARAVSLAEEFELDALDEVAAVRYDSVPLVRVVADSMARRSYRHSAITVPAGQAVQDVPRYPDAVFNQIMALWSVASYVYGEALGWREKRADEWREMERAYESVLGHMKALNASRESEGHVNKSLLTINWGQIACVGIPALRREAHEQRARWHRLEEQHARDVAGQTAITTAHRRAVAALRPVRRARAEYHAALRRWSMAVIVDDAMRVKNYARGLVNEHFLPELVRERPDGPPVLDHRGVPQLDGMTATFRGYDRVAGTKIRRKASGAQRVRSRALKPGVVDMVLLSDLVFDLRPADLVSSGILAREEDYRLEDDRWALFTQPRSRRPHGGYSEARLSKRFGQTIHWMHRDLLRLPDSEGRALPSWAELHGESDEGTALRARYRGLFSQHIARTILVTYLIGVHGDHAEAMHRTNDTREVLDAFYTEFANAVSEAKKLTGIRNPERFKNVTAHLIAGRVIDWAAFDPERPETAQVVASASPLARADQEERRARPALREHRRPRRGREVTDPRT